MRKPTKQQEECVAAIKAGNIKKLKVEAIAGSGKTSTLTMMAEAVEASSLYLAFNKVTAEEGRVKFPKHVVCQTTHSKAYAAFGADIRDKLSRPKGRYVNVAGSGSEIGRYYKLDAIELNKDHTMSSAFMGLLVKQTVMLFEQSADEEIGKHHIPRAELKKLELKTGANMSYTKDTIFRNARRLWKDRINPNSPVLATHDTYLKMYQLSKPVFTGYEILYVDEYQDTTPCVHDIVQRQVGHMNVVMVGDARQAIYGWRGAVNAMKMVDCLSMPLTKSFRYGQEIADVATMVLEGAVKIEGNEAITSVAGFDVIDTTQPYTRLFRTNTALLGAAINELRKGTEVSIEIDVKDFVKLLESALALYRGEMKGVKHEKLLAFENWYDMIEEAKFDAELNRISKVVSGGDAEAWIELLECHVNSDEPHVTFTTAHKSKGREWRQVMLESDFKSCYGESGWEGLREEEQNLLYVAVTRAISVLEYNNTVSEYVEYYKRNYATAVNDVVAEFDIEEMAA